MNKPGAAQSEEGSNTNNPLQDRLAGALSLSLNPAPRIAMMETGSSKAQASFPLSMDDAKKAIELFRSSKVVSVTINTGQEGGPVNVVQDYGPYKSSIKPFDQVTKFEGRKLEASKEHYEMSDRPTGTVTKAWNDMPARPGLPEPQR